MNSITQKGVAFLVVLLSLAFASCNELDFKALIDRQEDHLEKLRVLVETLSSAVSRLESAESLVSLKRSTGYRDSNVQSTGVHVKKSRPLWFERFQLLAEARLEVEATCAAVLPYTDVDGISKYFALGDVRGRVIVFSTSGDELIESDNPTESPVTAMLAYSPTRKNESFLFTGHADGSVVARKVWESAIVGEDWLGPVVGSPRVFLRGSEGGDMSTVELLEVHQIGRMRYVVVADADGRIRVFTENGTVYGMVRASSRPVSFMKQRNLFFTEKGVVWLDLRRMVVSERVCEGLDGSLMKSYASDVSERSRVYGFTLEGNLVHVVLLGDGVNLKCRVRPIKKLEVDGDVSLLAIKGYLLAVNRQKVFLYNISSQYYSRIGASRPVLVASLAELKSLFPSTGDGDDGSMAGKPLIASDRGKLVVLGLGGRYIGIYRPNFPVVKVQSNVVLWSSPALLFFMVLFGMWYFYVKKRRSFNWTPEESFAGPANPMVSNLLGPAGSDRAFADAQRAGDLRDLRSSMLRGPPRRYASPSSRYAGGGTSHTYRQSPADQGLVGGSELKYRGSQAVEAAGFPLRRDPIFTDNQSVEDHND